jgi:ribonuclease VapC
MVIDASAVLAWLKHEPERERIVAALEAHKVRRISAVSLLEANIVVRAREHHTMPGKLQRFLEEIDAIVMPFDEQQARLADDAFQRYGKGQGARPRGPTESG